MPIWLVTVAVIILGSFAATWSLAEWLCRRMEGRNRNTQRDGTAAANRWK